LRARKDDNGTVTYYLRSTVLGGAVVGELDACGGFSRGYFYRGDQLLAVQQSGHMYWVHEDAITKSQRTTDVYGAVTPNGVVELDPWGAGTSRNSGGAPFQPQNFAGYTRDGDGQQDAMARRYSVKGRFSQPDPSGASYDLTNPQSLDRYIYTKNDPVNYRDPSGLVSLEDFGGDPTKRHFGGWEGAIASGGGFSFMWLSIPGLERDHPNLLIGPWFGFGGGQDTVPTDLKARVLDITGNCSDSLDKFFNALSKSGNVFSRDFGQLLDRIQTVSTASDQFFAENHAPSYAAGLSLGGDDNRQIYIRSNEITARTAAANQQFRWNAIAQITIAELLHHSRTTGEFSDPQLDRAALSLLTGKELADAKAKMASNGYAAGSVGHTLVKSRCNPTNAYGAPPTR
jgi:RHS repeat-associated protein